METLFLIYGGKSAEHDISILTVSNILKNIDRTKYDVSLIYITKTGEWLMPTIPFEQLNQDTLKLTKDTGELVDVSVLKKENAVVFPVLHGPNGEDGTIQGLFEMLDVAYVGAGVLASACGMDKWTSKKIFAQAGIPQLPYVGFVKRDWDEDNANVVKQCEELLQYPMYVKPANMGSSVGVSRAEDKESLLKAIETAFQYDRRIVVETGVVAREVEVGLLGYQHIEASVVGEVVKVVDFYDFEEKYKNNQATLQIPANISDSVSEQLRAYAVKAVEALDVSGLTRCDFFLTENNDIYINEVNTLPGFTQFSMYPLLWEATGVPYTELIEKLIIFAKERYAEKKAYQIVE